MAHNPREFEIDVYQLADLLKDKSRSYVLVDVREPWELKLARLEDERLITLPLGLLPGQAQAQLPDPGPDHQEVFVLCHHGLRSAVAVRWLRQQGWHNTYNVAGGIDEYSCSIDRAIPRY